MPTRLRRLTRKAILSGVVFLDFLVCWQFIEMSCMLFGDVGLLEVERETSAWDAIAISHATVVFQDNLHTYLLSDSIKHCRLSSRWSFTSPALLSSLPRTSTSARTK